MKLIPLVLFLIIRPLCSFAFFEYDQKLENAYANILSLHFDEATKLLGEEKAEKPSNDLRLLYENYIDFLEAFITEEKNSFEILKRNASFRIDVISENEKNQSSPFFLYALAELNIQQALVKIKFEENISATAEIRKAFKLIERNMELFPDFELNRKVAGFLYAIVGAVPAKYNWLVNMAGMNGSIPDGLQQLRLAYDMTGQGRYKAYQTEILFYLGTIFSVFSPSGETVPLLDIMKKTAAANPLICYVYSNIMMKRGQNDEAIRSLDAVLALNNVFPFTFLYYKRGLCKLRKLDFSSAADFVFFLRNYHGINSIKSAYQKLAWIALLKNDTINYKSNLHLCSITGRALLDEDKDAQYEAESGEMPNTILLMSRLLFDGGYYQRALSLLAGKPLSEFPRFRDQLEITYRLGRIMQMTGNYQKAIQDYEITIQNGSTSKWHFAGNSAIMLGNIYEEQKQYGKAIKYYELCISMDFEQYKNSLDQKAKASIDRIKSLMNGAK
jgi:tetratricopeptide (TPR) repeat protein